LDKDKRKQGGNKPDLPQVSVKWYSILLKLARMRGKNPVGQTEGDRRRYALPESMVRIITPRLKARSGITRITVKDDRDQ